MTNTGPDLSQQTQEIEEIIRRAQLIVSASNLERLLVKIVEEAPALVDGAGCSVYLIPELVPAYSGKLVRGGQEIAASTLDREFIVLAANSREERKEDIGQAFYLKGEGLTGWIFEHGEPLQIKDMRDTKELHAHDPALHWADPYAASKLWYDKGQPQPFLGVPLLGTRKVFGVIKVPATISKQPFPRYAVDLFMSFAGVLSTIIRKTKLLEDLNHSISELLSITAIPEQQQWFEKIVDVAAQLIDGRDLGLYLLDAFGEQIELQAAQSDYLKQKLGEGKCSPYRRGEGLTGWVFKTGKPLCIRDLERYRERIHLSDEELSDISDGPEIDDEDRWFQWRDKDEEWLNSRDPAYLAVPIKAEDGSVLGVLRAPAVGTDPGTGRDKFFDSEDLRVFQSFADSVALFLQSMRRRELSNMLIELGTILDEEQLFQFVVDRTPRLVRARGCSILLMKPSREGKPLALSYTNSPCLKQASGKVIPLAYAIGEGKSGFVVDTGMALVINYYGHGRIQQARLRRDYERYKQNPNNLVDYLRDGHSQEVGLIRLVGDHAQAARHRDQFKAFVQTQQLKDKQGTAGLPSPYGATCETGGHQDAISFLAVPIKDEQGQVQGIIRLPRTDEGSNFSDEDLNLLESIANRLTITLRTLSLFRSNQERLEKLEKLSRSTTMLVTELWTAELGTRLQSVVNSAADILGAQVCSLWQVRRPGYIQLVASHGDVEGSITTDTGDPIQLPIQVGIHAGLTGYIAAGDKPVRLHGEQLRSHHAVKSADKQPHIPSGYCYSLLGIPLIRKAEGDQGTYETIGLLKAENKKDEDGLPNPLIEFTAEDEWILKVMADTVVAILDSARYIQELDSLQRVGAEVTGVLALDDVLSMLLKRLQEILSLEYAHIHLDDPQRGLIESTMGIQTQYTRLEKFPIKMQGREIGTLEIDHISRREIQTLERFITHAAVGIRNAQLFEQAESRRRKLESLAEISARLIEFTDKEHLFKYIVESAATLLSAEDCSLFIVDPVRSTIDLKASSALPPELIDDRLARVGTEPGIGLPGFVAATGKTLNYANAEHLKHEAHSGAYTSHIKYLPSRESHSLLIVPLCKQGDQVIGVLKVENKTGPNQAQGFLDDEELLTTLANQAVIAMSNVDLYETKEAALRRRVDQLIALRDIDSKILTSDSLDPILTTVLEKATSLSRMEVHSALITLHCSGGADWIVRARSGQESSWAGNLAADETIGKAMKGERGLSQDTTSAAHWKLAVPVQRAREVCGVIATLGTGQEDWLEEDLRWLEGLAGQIAIAVEGDERKRELARAQQGQAAAQQALLISGLSSIYAHNTHDVIGTIPLNVDYLRKQLGPSSVETQELLDDIRRAATNMMDLAGELRRPDFDKGEEVQVGDLLREAKKQVSIPDRIGYRTRGTRGLPAVFVPRLSTREVLANILKNAAQAIDKTQADHGAITVSCQGNGDRVMIEIRDTGCGFTGEKMAQLFEPVWRQPGRTARGMGYALWWAKTLLTAIGGSISAESPGPGQGATFRVWLPTREQQG